MKIKLPPRAAVLGLVLVVAAPLLADDNWRKPAGIAARFKVIGAKLEATPPEYHGVCNPHVTTFKGSIETDGPGDVVFGFVRSDGGATDPAHYKTIHFAAAGHQNIPDETWSLWANPAVLPPWVQIKIVSPNAGFTSNKAFFRINCTGGTVGTQEGRKPDLVIESFGFTGPTSDTSPKPTCEPHTAVYNFQVVVKNIGSAPSPSSASLGNKALVQAMAQDKPGWGNGAFLNALAPGATQTVNIPVYYLMADPGFMVNNAPHPFKAIADPLGLVNEQHEDNNEKGPIKMGPPAGCEKLKK